MSISNYLNNKDTSYKQIILLAIPIILTGIAEPLINSIDLSMIGHRINGGIGAVGLGSSATLSIVWIISAFLTPISARIGVYNGKNQFDKIQHLSSWALLRGFCCFIILSVFLFFLSEEIILLYSPNDLHIKGLSIDFLKYRTIGLPFLLGSITLFNVFKGLKITRLPFVITFAGGIINLFGDYILIDGFYSIPPLGIKGAALASSISHLFMFSSSIYFSLKLNLLKIEHIKKTPSNIKLLFSNSTNFLLRTIILNATLFIGNKITAQQGTNYLEVHTILTNIFIISSFFLDGIAGSSTILISNLNNQVNRNKIKEVGIKSIISNLVLGLTFCFILSFTINPILSFYSNNNSLSLVLSPLCPMFLISLTLSSVAFTMDGICVGVEKITLLRNTLIISTFMGFGLTLVILNDYTLFSVWIAFSVWLLLRGVVPLYYFLKNYV